MLFCVISYTYYNRCLAGQEMSPLLYSICMDELSKNSIIVVLLRIEYCIIEVCVFMLHCLKECSSIGHILILYNARLYV